MMTPFRFDGLALGGGAACIAADPRLLVKIKSIIPWVLGASLIIAISIAFEFGSGATTNQMDTFGYAALALSLSCLVLHCATTASPVSKVFLFSPLRHLGKYSYGIYLFHFVLVRPPSFGLNRAVFSIILGSVGSYLLARVSWRFVEQPFLRLKRHFEYRSAIVLATSFTCPAAE